MAAAIRRLLALQLAAGLHAAGLPALDALTPDNAHLLLQVDWAALMPPGAALAVQQADPDGVTPEALDAAQRAAADAMRNAAAVGVHAGQLALEEAGVRFAADPNLAFLNEEAQRWALAHAAMTIGRMHDTTRRWVQQAVARFIALGEPQRSVNRELVQELTRETVQRLGYAFSPARAEAVAVTEVTAAFYEGSVRRYAAAGVRRVRWLTARDDVLCDLCGPMDGAVAVLDAVTRRVEWPHGMSIPAHPHCRCFAAPVVE